MRHGSLAFMLPLCAATLVAVIALAFLVASQSSKIDAFLGRAPQQTTMPVPPDEIKLETSWCYKRVEPPPPLHTTVTVTTMRNPGETPAEHLARHMERVATQQETTPDNCQQH